MIVEHVTPELDISENVAIVASSPCILSRTHGSFIDEFDDVIRFNRSPVNGYEIHTGLKTTIRVTNQHVFAGVPHAKVGNWTNKGQPANFIRKLRNMKVLMIGPQNNGAEWSGRDKSVHSSSEPYLADYGSVIHICDIHGFGHGRPSIGFAIIHLCVKSGIIPSLFGFGLDDEFAQHYWEDKGTHMSHHYKYERSVIRSLEKEGKVIVYE